MAVSLNPRCRKLLIDLGAREIIGYLLKRLETSTSTGQAPPIETEQEVTTRYENEKQVLAQGGEEQEEEDSKMPELIPFNSHDDEEEDEILVSPPLSRSSSSNSSHSMKSTSEEEEDESEQTEEMEIDNDEYSDDSQDSEEDDDDEEEEEDDEDYLTFPRLPSEEEEESSSNFTRYYYFKLSLLDSFISRHSKNLIAEDELSLRQFALQVIEAEEPIEKVKIEERKKFLKGLRKDLQVCNDENWRESRKRFLEILQRYFERLPNLRKRRERDDEGVEFEENENFVDLGCLRRPELNRGVDRYSSYYFNRGERSGNLRKKVLITQAFRRIDQDLVVFDDDQETEEGGGNPVPTSIMLEQLNRNDGGEEVVRGRKRQWSEFESDETYFNQLPTF
ncbi:hypothetical protein JCM5350_008262 [Sporobolomyces pararoseus]